ncbi:MAG: hypothetical protein ABI114_10115 [Rhodanobacter sp.]
MRHAVGATRYSTKRQRYGDTGAGSAECHQQRRAEHAEHAERSRTSRTGGTC